MKTVIDFIEAKKEGRKISMVSTYEYWSAAICEEAGIDSILVGDSAGMVVQGLDTTLPVTLEEMIYHAKAVRRGAPNTFIVVDMPFMSYQVSVEDAVKNAGKIMKETGANAVKIEGGEEVAHIIEKLVSVGIPVMGHLGLTPQSVHALGGYRIQGKSEEQQKKIIKDAKVLEQAGVFSIVLEAVPSRLAKEITEFVEVATIGIGAGKYTDGQILVFHDMMGFFDRSPKFVKRYVEGKKLFIQALEEYREEIQKGKFPEQKHIYE
ncbi:3-methyl-2-oxobutanoate hydroxymethyltransferase [Persephonella hydrogeniphila]|uniref:3-methyl-2-oxobutanoate hydroxymethyltransferase n=1 Tax=Persephonella hydrogeniphila TaxID=198703 RepID=A0A285NHI9_9AQUI|nr:3-methyl-2-oxobutanoate hydroxymethyltransferase [Persephonella hydrogeniphila]SNZ08909.1 3-methyl-2-oxobutanoate hydroxymethyltransferase [Persephonella hydrogeniphila]